MDHSTVMLSGAKHLAAQGDSVSADFIILIMF